MEMRGEREHSSMEEFITSFKQKINMMGTRGELVYVRPTIVSRSDTLTESVQSHQRPSRLSIGPLHWGDANLRIIEHFKWFFMYISNIGSFSYEELSVCFLRLKELEDECRRSYSVIVDMTSDVFVQMLFVDACFLVLLTLAELEERLPSRQPLEEPSLSTARNLLSEGNINEILTSLKSLNVFRLDRDVTTDALILGNQIPFFILEYMWKWLLETLLRAEPPLDFLACHRLVNDVPSETIFPEKIHHYLHFFHCSLIPPPSPNWQIFYRYQRDWIPSATELKESGIKFRLVESGRFSLILTFKDGVIHIPEKILTELDRTLIENVVDFEQSVRGDHSTYFSNYVWIMSCLLCKEDDVRTLSMQSSFTYGEGWDKDVQRFFHNLERRCSYWKVDDQVKTLFSQINDYRLSRRNRWMVSFQRKFCSSLWVTLSVTGAIILFILTFLQTFFAMYAYFHPPN